jgi:hypothetical protein
MAAAGTVGGRNPSEAARVEMGNQWTGRTRTGRRCWTRRGLGLGFAYIGGEGPRVMIFSFPSRYFAPTFLWRAEAVLRDKKIWQVGSRGWGHLQWHVGPHNAGPGCRLRERGVVYAFGTLQIPQDEASWSFRSFFFWTEMKIFTVILGTTFFGYAVICFSMPKASSSLNLIKRSHHLFTRSIVQ